jgi:hypothetical protein
MTRAETRFRLSTKRTSPFKSAGASVHSTTGSRGVCISGSNAGYTMFRGSVKGTGYPLHSPVSPSLPVPCVTACHHISNVLYVHTENKSAFAVQKNYAVITSRFSSLFTTRLYATPINTILILHIKCITLCDSVYERWCIKCWFNEGKTDYLYSYLKDQFVHNYFKIIVYKLFF